MATIIDRNGTAWNLTVRGVIMTGPGDEPDEADKEAYTKEEVETLESELDKNVDSDTLGEVIKESE